MIGRYPVGFKRRGLCIVALVLCISVIMQMLGAPVTLLSAGDMSDEFSGSVLEGLSVPQMPSPLTLASASFPAVELLASARLPVLGSEQFHPPAS
jgi:hypothetical protein